MTDERDMGIVPAAAALAEALEHGARPDVQFQRKARQWFARSPF